MSLPGLSFSRREGTILRQVQEHVRLVQQTEQELPRLVSSVAEGDTASCHRTRDRIFELENKADIVHRDVSTQIAEGAFFGGVREDMLGLLEKIDNIADRAKDAAQLITLTEINDEKAREVLRSDDMRQFLANLDQAVASLLHLVEAFKVDRKTVLERVHTVEKYEEAADASKHNVLVMLFDKTAGSMDPVTLLLVRDFLFCADDVADNAEDASDVVLVLVAKGYG